MLSALLDAGYIQCPFFKSVTRSHVSSLVGHFDMQLCLQITLLIQLPHVDNASNASSVVHIVEGLVDSAQIALVRDKFINLESAILILLNEPSHLRTAFDTTESASLPHAASDELNSYNESVLR